MFTGIIEYAGTVEAIEVGVEGARLTVNAGPMASRARVGASVAVNGTCLTVVDASRGRLQFDAINETLRRTSLGSLRPGDRVNLERPMPADGRFDGHIVQGHVDGTGELIELREDGASRVLRFSAAPNLLRYIIEKGSITLDGISLTVAALGDAWFEVAIIPHTWEVTNLSARRVGDRVNVEVDLVAKYVERLLAAGK